MIRDIRDYTEYFFIGAFLVLAYLTFLLIKPFFSPIVLSLFLVYLFHPLHTRLKKKTGDLLSAAILTIAVMLITVIPLFIFVNLLVKEAFVLYETVNVDTVSDFFAQINSGQLASYVPAIIEKGIGALTTAITNFILTVPEKVVGIFIIILGLFFGLKDGDKLIERIELFMPVKRDYRDKIIKKFTETMDSVVYGSILVGILEGIIATIGFLIFGVSTPLLWGFFTAVFALLPFVGPMAIWLPLSLYLYFTGHQVQAIGLAVYSIFFLTLLLDNVFKHYMISRKGKIHPLISLLGVLGGIGLFGITGIVLGPFLLTVFILVVEFAFGGKNEVKS